MKKYTSIGFNQVVSPDVINPLMNIIFGETLSVIDEKSRNRLQSKRSH